MKNSYRTNYNPTRVIFLLRRAINLLIDLHNRRSRDDSQEACKYYRPVCGNPEQNGIVSGLNKIEIEFWSRLPERTHNNLYPMTFSNIVDEEARTT